MLVASKVEIDPRMFENGHLKGKRKTNLRRRIIIEYIQSKPAGEVIKTTDFMRIGRFTTYANTHTFVNRMVRDGVISRFESEKKNNYYYAVVGAMRLKKPADKPVEPEQTPDTPVTTNPDINGFIADMQRLGVQFSITITNEKEAKSTT